MSIDVKRLLLTYLLLLADLLTQFQAPHVLSTVRGQRLLSLLQAKLLLLLLFLLFFLRCCGVRCCCNCLRTCSRHTSALRGAPACAAAASSNT
jgi:hypothetical protein